MLLEGIERRCADFGKDLLCAASPTREGVNRIHFLARVQTLREDLQALGVAEGTRIGLSLPNGVDLLTAIVATWRLGASFVPLDPREVRQRRASIIREGQLAAVLAADVAADLADVDTLAATIKNGHVISHTGQASKPATARPADEAYVIFTSGSTGTPKGVSVGHGALASYLAAAQRAYEVPVQGLIVPSQLPPTFDAALTTLLLPLVTSNVAVPIADATSATRALAEVLRRAESPVLMKTTPSQLRLLAEWLSPNDIDALAQHGTTIIVGGEALDFADVALFRRASIGIFNEYGPTETTVGCSAYRVRDTDPSTGPVPIGSPFPGVTFTIEAAEHDQAGQGELLIAGPSVANGYVNAPDTGRFVGTGRTRAYRTGDRVRIDAAEGYFHFLGRTDDQVKVNGFRVELADVDTALRDAFQGPAVAVLIAGALVAVVEQHTTLDLDGGSRRLRELLPSYMQPASVRSVPRMPLTAHGKVDRRALSQEVAAPQVQASADSLAAQVAQRWRPLLGDAAIRPDTDFFAAGAHSITALTMVGHLADDLGVDVPITLIFDHPTLADFVEALRARIPASEPQKTTEAATPILSAPGATRTPSAPQLAVLGAEGWARDRAQFTVVAAARVAVHDWEDLQQAVADTLQRNEVLTWRFGIDSKLQITAAASAAPTHIDLVDARRLPDGAAERMISDRLTAERLQPIDLLDGAPAAHAVLIRTDTLDEDRDHGIIVLIAHHAVVDEASIALLWTEIMSRLSQVRPTPDPDLRYARWAAASVTPAAQHRSRDAADYLVSKLAAADLGYLATAATAQATDGALPLELPADLTASVEDAARRLSLPPSALYGAAVTAALTAFTTSNRYALLVPVTNRRTSDDFDTVGCFVSSVPVAVAAPNSSQLSGEWVRQWHHLLLDATAHAHADTAAIAAQMRTASPNWSTGPRISLVIERPFTSPADSAAAWTPLPITAGPPKHHLSIFLSTTPGQPMTGRIEWMAVAFHERRAQELVSGMLAGLATLAGSMDVEPVSEVPAADNPTVPTQRDGGALPGVETDTDLASVIAGMASTILGQELTPTTDLFTAGAQSLELVRLCAAIRTRFGHQVDLVDVFDHSTPQTLAAFVQTRTAASYGRDLP